MTRSLAFAPEAIEELAAIWRWNAKNYDSDHADRYLSFLRREIESLCQPPERGRPLASRPDTRYLLMRRKNSGHGHIAVYRCLENIVQVEHVFHSAQNWQELTNPSDK